MVDELTSLQGFAKALTASALLVISSIAGPRTMLAEIPSPSEKSFLIGWASADITPQEAVVIGGMPSARISTGVQDPLTATALALDAPYKREVGRAVIMISCDLRNVSDAVREGVRKVLKRSLPEVDSGAIIFNATHTHTAPPLGDFGVDLNAMVEDQYVAFAVPRIAAAAENAWKNRRPGGISFGLAHAVAGHNRIVSYLDGKSRMYGRADNPDFSHVEGYEDHSVNLMYTWDKNKKLTGVLINVSVPSQVSQSESRLSADYWHETREELRSRLGKDLFVFPQCGAAGDQSPTILVNKKAEARMERLTGQNRRQRIAGEIANATTSILPVMEKSIEWNPVLAQRMAIVPLSARIIGEEDVRTALANATAAKEIYEKSLKEIEENPELKKQDDWYKAATKANRTMRQGFGVEERFRNQANNPTVPAEVHILRIGEMVIATNPFELYVDYGMQIKARSKAEQTFVVQLAGGGTYIPTTRSVAGGAYGATPTSTRVGPEGGRELVDWTVNAIAEMWPVEVKKETIKAAAHVVPGKP